MGAETGDDRGGAAAARFSVLLASRNEGERLRRTVDDVLRHAPRNASNEHEHEVEIVIIDDASSDDSTAFVSEPAYAGQLIRVERNEGHRGLIYSRARAAELARGQYIAFLDAHCAVSPGWLEALAAELHRIDNRGLVVPALYKLRAEDWSIDLESGGAAACTISSPFLDFSWTTPRRVDGNSCTCTMGGGAWMCHRDWYQHIGGLDRGMLVWGLENIDVPLRTWIAGGWCLVAEHVNVGHLYNESPTFLLSDVDFAYNKIRAAHNVFSAETFTKLMETLLYLGGFREALTRVHAERETLATFKDRVESVRERTDRWLIDTFRLPLLESPEYHLAPRRPKVGGDLTVPRPPVSVVVPVAAASENSERLLAALEKSTYGNFDIVLTVTGGGAERERKLAESWRSHPRVRMIMAAEEPSSSSAANAAAEASDAGFVAFLPEDTVTLSEHWIEEFLLLAERRPRFLMACPRTQWEGGSANADPEESYEFLWDWEAPGFFRARTGEPLSESAYQVMGCHETLLFVNREAFLRLGGFDANSGELSAADLAIHGWLSGFEVFCQPRVSVIRQRDSNRAARTRRKGAAGEFASVLPAVKYFSSSRRARCRELCPRAEPLLRRNAASIDRRRSEFLERALYDDDWLFFKFNVEAGP